MNKKDIPELLEGSEDLVLAGEYDAAKMVCKEALKLDANHPATLYQLTQICNAMFEYDEAMKYSRHLAHSDAKNPEAWYNLGYYAGTIGEHDEACNALERCISLDRSYAEAYYRLAVSQKYTKTPKMLDIARRKIKETIDLPSK